MSLLKKIKPQFWDHYDVTEGIERPFSFRRKWKLIVILTSIVALTPLVIMTLIDFQLTKGAIESEILVSTTRTLSSNWRTISFFLTQRKTALEFIARDNTYEELRQPFRLHKILTNLKEGIGGVEDIGLIDADGYVRAYAGPYHLQGKNVNDDDCFQSVIKHGYYIKDMHSENQASPRFVMAIKHGLADGSFFVLRSGIDNKLLHSMLSQLEIGENDDAFIINANGILQTPSRFYGKIFDKISLPIPKYTIGARMSEINGQNGQPVFMGYAYIPDTSLILMIVKPKSEMMALWYKPRIRLIGLLVLGVALILIAILGTATYLVNRIHAADRQRMEAFHQMEHTNKLASLGRLASGVAHEINNPLEIINQKAGLIKDLFNLNKNYPSDEKLMDLINGVLSSVERAGSITKRLLNLARHLETDIEIIDLSEMIRDLIRFLAKEAELRHIEIVLNMPQDRIEIICNQGNLQQIFLNLINNAFAAMADGGQLDIIVKKKDADTMTVIVADNGHGIPADDLKRVFEPFFTTRLAHRGTGLGLSITYGLVQEIGGEIAVESKLGEGTRFIISLPLKVPTHQKAST
jgi:two-component system NtrC family sensor kinase